MASDVDVRPNLKVGRDKRESYIGHERTGNPRRNHLFTPGLGAAEGRALGHSPVAGALFAAARPRISVLNKKSRQALFHSQLSFPKRACPRLHLGASFAHSRVSVAEPEIIGEQTCSLRHA